MILGILTPIDCALAGFFPTQFRQGEMVVKSNEVTLSSHGKLEGYTEEALELRDILLFFVDRNKNLLIRKAALTLGIHP